MASHPIDYLLIGNNFGTPEMRQIWSEQNRMAQQIAVEVALAQAEGELGIIPAAAAAAIQTRVDPQRLDVAHIAAQAARMKHSFMPTLDALAQQCGEAGEYIHYGATTQDIIDTATVLQLRQALKIIQRDCIGIAQTLYRLADEHRRTPMAGRTHGMQALPTTFGFKAAVWLDEFLRHLARLGESAARVLTGNISGAVCTYAAMGEQGPEIERRALAKLGLATPNIGWQSARDRFSEFAAVAVMISGTLGKIGNELYNLMRSEIAEIEEPFSAGKIGSTTMPHKRNPAALEGLASLTAPLRKSVGLIFESMHVEHERDAMSWRAEWIALPEISIYLSAQLQNAQQILSGLKVNKARMLSNLQLHGGLLLSEKVMFELGKVLGKQTAHHLVYQCAMAAHESGEPFKTALLRDERIARHITPDNLDRWLDPTEYLGSAPQKVAQVLRYADHSGLLAAGAEVPA
ncbi:adenylosuccinate lyase [Brenneria populi]|uniref:Adenylosuccinate lyase n=1 Tax=Brenneria populi TaxID=1505588 RepID=A0ABU6JUW7_9GAMM|nr:adenylosuccinate lyase [Brenneria populi Li et al. 2015]